MFRKANIIEFFKVNCIKGLFQIDQHDAIRHNFEEALSDFFILKGHVKESGIIFAETRLLTVS